MSSWTAASSDCSRPVNNYVHVKTADLYRPNARLTPERQGYQVLTPFGKLGYSLNNGIRQPRPVWTPPGLWTPCGRPQVPWTTVNFHVGAVTVRDRQQFALQEESRGLIRECQGRRFTRLEAGVRSDRRIDGHAKRVRDLLRCRWRLVALDRKLMHCAP